MKRYTFEVQLTIPADNPEHQGWARNRRASIICATPERACALAREQYPGCEIHQVMRRGAAIIVDDADGAA